MRAAVLTALNAPLELHDVEPAGPLAYGQLLVRVLVAGVCGAQLQEIRGEKGGPLPHLMGHEGCGLVEAIGSGVTLAVLLLHLVGPHAPDLDAPTVHYDAQTRSSWIGPRNATAPPPAPVSDIPKIAPGQPLGNVTLSPVPSTDRFGTFTPGKHP